MGKNSHIIGGVLLPFFFFGFFFNVFASSSVIFHGSRNEKKIVFTFDADMTPGMREQLRLGRVANWYNHSVVDYLRKTKTPATIFLTGMWMELYPQITKELSNDPLFELGNHSYSHPSLHGKCYGLRQIDDRAKEGEITTTEELLKKYHHTTNYFRFPGGCYGGAELALVARHHLRTIQWDVVGGDAFAVSETSGVNNIISRVKNGSIIVLHLQGGQNAPKTAQILESVIPTLQKKGFRFVKLSDLHI